MNRQALFLAAAAFTLLGCEAAQRQAPPAERRVETEPPPAERRVETAPPPAAEPAPAPASDVQTDPLYTGIVPTGSGRISAPGAPLASELPDLRFEETRTTSVRAGVEQWGEQRLRTRIVPEFAPIELTEQEREILGEPDEDPAADLLMFYRQPRSAEHGVIPFESQVTGAALPSTGVAGTLPMRTAVAGVDVASVGRYVIPTFGRTGAATYSERAGAGRSYDEGAVRIGYDGPRRAAGRAPTLDP